MTDRFLQQEVFQHAMQENVNASVKDGMGASEQRRKSTRANLCTTNGVKDHVDLQVYPHELREKSVADPSRQEMVLRGGRSKAGWGGQEEERESRFPCTTRLCKALRNQPASRRLSQYPSLASIVPVYTLSAIHLGWRRCGPIHDRRSSGSSTIRLPLFPLPRTLSSSYYQVDHRRRLRLDRDAETSMDSTSQMTYS